MQSVENVKKKPTDELLKEEENNREYDAMHGRNFDFRGGGDTSIF